MGILVWHVIMACIIASSLKTITLSVLREGFFVVKIIELDFNSKIYTRIVEKT